MTSLNLGNKAKPIGEVKFSSSRKVKDDCPTVHEVLLKKHSACVPNQTTNEGDFPSRSIEIYFGSLTDFNRFYDALSEEGYLTPPKQMQVDPDAHSYNSRNCSTERTKINPQHVKKLVLVGHPLRSFQGLSRFKSLVECWVTNSDIREIRSGDIDGLKTLSRLYVFSCSLRSIAPMTLLNLKILSVSRNKLTKLDFITSNLCTLTELNAADNLITFISEDDVYNLMSLEILNLAGNPLCTLQDIKAINVLPCLKSLWLVDPTYGKCPVASNCDSRTMIVNTFNNIVSLNGSRIKSEELQDVKDYVEQRRIYYYANSKVNMSSYSNLRKAAMSKIYRQSEYLSGRMAKLITLAAHYEKALYIVDMTPPYFEYKQLLHDEIKKIHKRIDELNKWCRLCLSRFQLIMQISRWEEKMDEWTKWLEYQSYGGIQSYISHSVLDPSDIDPENIRSTIFELLSALSCTKQPSNLMLKVETIIPIISKGLEIGMERIYDEYFKEKKGIQFVLPPPESRPSSPVPKATNSPSIGTGLGSMNRSYVATYMPEGYVIPEPVFDFPESVFGLPERPQPIFMYLICPHEVDEGPVDYFHKVIERKAELHESVKLTNCLWLASKVMLNKTTKNIVGTFSVIIVVKVLETALEPYEDYHIEDLVMGKTHGPECAVFTLKHSLSMAPAYVINISYAHKDVDSLWYNGGEDDVEYFDRAKASLTEVGIKLNSYGVLSEVTEDCNHNTMPFFLKKTLEGIEADLTSIKSLDADSKEFALYDYVKNTVPSKSGVDINQIGKSLGLDVAFSLSSLTLSRNNLNNIRGLHGLTNLRKLNLSHNNLTTISGIQKMPVLCDLNVSHNFIRFLHSNLGTLSSATPRLTNLWILPNPIQDVREISHVSVLASQALPLIQKVDQWNSTAIKSGSLSIHCPKANDNFGFSTTVLSHTWVGCPKKYDELQGNCLTCLDQMPLKPPFADSYENNGVTVNLSDNYLSNVALACGPFVQMVEWRTSIIELELQENVITSLDWMKEKSFPNLKILNLSNNQISQLEGISNCPALAHLHLSGNLLPANTVILYPLKELRKLVTLDVSRNPVAGTPDYVSYVSKSFKSLQILDGNALSTWQTEEAIERLGGVLSNEWLENNIGHQHWGTLTQLSLPSCGLQKIMLHPQTFPNLLSIDLKSNSLTTLSGLSSLPNLRVLCVSYNNISTLGDLPCPTCFSLTVESYVQTMSKNLTPVTSHCTRGSFSRGSIDRIFYDPSAWTNENEESDIEISGSAVNGKCIPSSVNAKEYTAPLASRRCCGHNCGLPVFPQLEALIISHNNLAGVNDLHLHSMPSLQTLVMNCNDLPGVHGLDNLRSLQAIILDNNNIREVPPNAFTGCGSLRYLHLEHNRITAVPRLPHLTNLAALYLAHNKIQSLTDIQCFETNHVTEMSLVGNPASSKGEYVRQISNRIPNLSFLDGHDILEEKAKKSGIASSKLFPTARSRLSQDSSKVGTTTADDNLKVC